MKHACNTSLVLRKGAWSAEEDTLLKNCIEKHGEGKWNLVPLKAGLRRYGKSCRLRWLNYLRPNIKRGDFKEDEIDLIRRLHKLLGNRQVVFKYKWSLISGRIPGRTANDVKNYWNTHLRSRVKQQKKKHQDAKSSEDHTMVTIIKPQPHTLSKPLNWFKGDNQVVETHEVENLLRSSDDDANSNYNISPRLISSPVVLDDPINEFLKELFDEGEKTTDNEIGWLFDDPKVEGEALNVVEDNENSLFDFPTDEVMWNLLNLEQL
ncbi:hypothetical protein OSB04_000341 [Centaurea solstitialis]|uniref:Uncharacterized protein n=1 Tax=Centaurea solstitialis TaxID=347529 RepID=A0AA38TNV2_9ASTR|nr:hypothetical protein OSB04_000341 [Centaurea solstitialis]